MNIAVFSRSTSDHFVSGGMETQLKNLVEGLVGHGHKILVITTSYPIEHFGIEKCDKYKTINGVNYLYLGNTTPGLNPISNWEKPWKKIGLLNRNNGNEGELNYFIASKQAFLKIHNDNSFDVVISQSTAGQGLVGYSSIPIISIIHGTISNEIKNRLKGNKSIKNWVRFLVIDLPKWNWELFTSNRKFFRNVKFIVAVSGILKNQFISEHRILEKGLLASKTHVIYNGVDSTYFKPGTKKYPKFTALYIGRMDREKGLDLIIKAVEILNKTGTDINAKLIGGGVHLEEFKEFALKLGVRNKIEFLGQIPNNELLEYYQKSHIFVFPSRREEGQPMTVSEAYCSGLPVIGTKKGGLAEIIKHEKTGLFVNENDAFDLANNIKRVKNDPDLLKKMSTVARREGESEFSRGSMIHKYEKLLKLINEN